MSAVVDLLFQDLPVAVLWAFIGAAVLGLVGLVSGTDETATIAPITLMVVLLGVPPVGVYAFFIAAIMAKHLTHAIPTMMLGIPGDTLAIPLLREADALRHLGLPHVALQKAISAGLIAAIVAVPISVGIAALLSGVSEVVTALAPWIFLAATLIIAYLTPARWAAIAAIIPFVLILTGIKTLLDASGVTLSTSFFLGIASGPLIVSLLGVLSPEGRRESRRRVPDARSLAPAPPASEHYFPNPLRVLDRAQRRWVVGSAAVTSTAFMFSPVALTVIVGEVIRRWPKALYHRLTSSVAVRNATTEATYIGEIIIPLMAFGLPLSPTAVGPGQPLFNAEPRFTVDGPGGAPQNLGTMLTGWEFLVWGLVSVLVAGIVVYPLAMRYAAAAARFVLRHVSHEAVIAAFLALILMVSAWEGGLMGSLVVVTVGMVGGLLGSVWKVHAGVQFMAYYVAIMTVPAMLALV